MTALQPGTRLGPYQIADLLGVGGMGEVYRAIDTRLDRSVAIKILPAEFAREPDRRQRFEREARVVAALNHPHICTLFDVGQQDGLDYLVLEVLEGETLASRLRKGPLPLEQVLRIGIEMADALDRAHRKGVVHRDLKPGNVMLTRSGTKLLDFGLAKLQPPDPSLRNSQISARATEDKPLTGAHAIVGTVPYMAPEQLEGKEADARTDIFALGAMVYEMATGRRAFAGESWASLAAAILGSEPPAMASVQPLTPPALDRLTRACLAKDPDNRIQSAHDVMLELSWIKDVGSEAGVAAPAHSQTKPRERALAGVALASFVIAALSGVAYWRSASKPAGPLRLSVLPPDGQSFFFSPGDPGGAEHFAPPALSADGRNLVFGAVDRTGVMRLWIRSLGSFEPRLLEGTEGGGWPFWSPDGRFVAFFANGKLWKVAATGGPPQSLCDAKGPLAGGTWSRLHTLVFSGRFSLYQVAETGGTATPLTETGSRGSTEHHLWPAFLPDGRKFLFLVTSENPATRKEKGGIYIGELGSKETRRLLSDASNAQAGADRLFFVRDGALTAQPFDGSAVTGAPVILGTSVQADWDSWRNTFGASETGVVFYRRAAFPRTQLAWHRRDGGSIKKVGDPKSYGALSLSRDGKRAAVSLIRSLEESSVWIVDFVTEAESRLTFDTGWEAQPVWSPDGQRIVYSRLVRGYPDLVWRPADGSAEPKVLVQSDDSKFATDWSRDGRYIAFNRSSGRSEVWLFSLEEAKATRFAAGEGTYSNGHFSPDGQWLAYNSDLSGRFEVYVRPLEGAGGPWQVSSSGGTGAYWRPDGKELGYLTLDRPQRVEVVSLALGHTVQAGPPRTLFVVPPNTTFVRTADGERFLIGTTVADDTPQAISVILDGVDQQNP